MLAAASMVLAAMTSSAWAATPEDCQRAIDDVSITCRANCDSATEAEMTSYLNAANTALMQKGGSAQATAGLKDYQQQLDAATKAQKIKFGDSNVLKEKLNKAMQCVSSLRQFRTRCTSANQGAACGEIPHASFPPPSWGGATPDAARGYSITTVD
jgi:hypothetical protein